MEPTKEDQGLLERRFSRRLQVSMIGEGVLVGGVVGLIITLYRMALSHAERALRMLIGSFEGIGLPFFGWLAALVVFAIIVARLIRLEPDTSGSGIPQIDAEVMGRMDMCWWRVIMVKFVEGVLCAFSGLSLGREGPSVQLGGMAGKGVSRLMHKDQVEEHILVTCGAAAGMSAAFHAPLTGVLFALEEIHREFNAALVISAMAATAAADFVSSHVLGIQPVLKFMLVGDLPHVDYLLVLLMGVICGLVGALHNEGMFFIQDRIFGPLRRRIGAAVLLVPFLLAGAMALAAPELLCGGDAILLHLEQNAHLTAGVVISLLIGKYLFTSICFGSSAPGGTLLPLVIMGSLVGALFGIAAIGATDVPLTYLNNFIILGVAGLFASSVRAPVTAVVLCFELTGSLDTLLAATAVSLLSYVSANLVKSEPFYEHLLSNLLAKLPLPEGMTGHEIEGQKVLHTHVVGVGSIAEGAQLKDVPWPPNSLVVTIDRAGQRVIPRGSTQLQALDQLLVIMDADLEADTELILHGICGGRGSSDASHMG